MDITVCVGSSCHLKGSREVVKKLQELVEKRNLQDKVILKGGFCLGYCSFGVAMLVDNEPVYGITPENVEEFFNGLEV